MRGPIDYIIVGFKGNRFDGSILQSLGDAVDKGIIALVAMSFITKDQDGNVATIDLDEMSDGVITSFTQKYPVSSKNVDQDDIDEMADLLENNTSAGLLVIEQLWAKPLKKALIDANGILLAEGRIHPDAAYELNKEGEQ